MQHSSRIRQLLYSFACGLLIQAPLPASTASLSSSAKNTAFCSKNQSQPNFFVMGGGGAPAYNEIALEKNVLYFQRILRVLGYKAEEASIFFANGNNGQATVRYINKQGQQQFKAPKIPNLKGAATLTNLQRHIQQTARENSNKPLFFYFTGHGGKNAQNLDNNSFILWNEQQLSVKQFAQMLDQMPQRTPVVAMMAQCFSGSFANFIYKGGDPKHPVALQTRCGFFATVSSLPSVGCTPEVNEADYRDYSSSFFAGLSGRDRTGKAVASGDYNKDGRVSYAEAHAFAKVDEKSIDLPISTSEAWLQSKASEQQQETILSQPINQVVKTARPEQRYVVSSLIKTFGLDGQKSFLKNIEAKSTSKDGTEEQQAYLTRLGMELINIGWEKQIRTSRNPKDIVTLERLVKCESGSWGKPEPSNQ